MKPPIKLRAGTNFQMYINDSTDLILLAKSENEEEIKRIQPAKMEIGRFYFIKYNYNGNKIWCPIFTLEYKYYNQKNILYAINLDYLPYLYKLNLFNIIWLKQRAIFEYNAMIEKIDDERRLEDVNFENIYNILKKNGNFEYCITAFDMDKLKEVYLVSYNLMGRFIFLSTKKLNTASMKDLYDKELNKELKEKIGSILENYQKILNEYSEDSKEFYKKLKSFETQFKLIENSK